MTAAILSVALLFTAPATTEEPTVWPVSPPSVSTAITAPTTSLWYPDLSDIPTEIFGVVIESPALIVASPPPEPPPPPRVPTDAELVDELFGWPGRQLVACESSWNRWAVGRYGERGLFQIHPVHRARIAAMGYSFDDMFEAEPNIRVAVEIRRVQGLKAWTCWKG